MESQSGACSLVTNRGACSGRLRQMSHIVHNFLPLINVLFFLIQIFIQSEFLSAVFFYSTNSQVFVIFILSLKNCDPNITQSEIRCFIGILIISDYNRLPSKRMFWDMNNDVKNILQEETAIFKFKNTLKKYFWYQSIWYVS